MRLRAFRHRFFWGDTLAERRFGKALLLILLALTALLVIGGPDWRDASADTLQEAEERFERRGDVFADGEERERALFKSLRREQFVRSGLWWAALVNLGLALALFFTRPWWCGRPLPAEGGLHTAGSRRGLFWLAVGLAVLAGAVLRGQRMGQSLYNDETFNVRHYIHGQYKSKPDGTLEYKPVTWADTFWKNKANNGVMFSVLARLSAGEVTPGATVSEARLRLPALVPGLLSIIVIALLGRSLFGSPAGAAAAWWFALHPWHLRYCTEARAYGLVILFAALAMLFLVRALRDNRWGAWLGFGASQFALLWSYAGALYFALALHIVAAVVILRRRRDWRRAALGRLLATGVLSAMPFFQLMAPNFPQMARGLQDIPTMRGKVDAALVSDIGSYLATGMPAVDRDPSNALNPALAKFWPGGWWLLVPGLLAAALLLAFAVPAFRRSGFASILMWSNFLALAIALGASAATGSALYRWYIIYLLPFAVLPFAAGWAELWHSRRLRPLAVLLPAAMLALVQVPLRNYIAISKQDLRGVASTARAGGAISAGFWTDAAFYDPQMKPVGSPDEIRALVARAEREGRALHVAFGHRSHALRDRPGCVDLLENSGAFEHVVTFPGLEEQQFTSYVYRWNGRPPDQ